jgi:hypothetical protein
MSFLHNKNVAMYEYLAFRSPYDLKKTIPSF